MHALCAVLLVLAQEAQKPAPPKVTADEVRAAGKVVGLEFSDKELALMLRSASDNLESFERMRKVDLPNSVAPTIGFSARIPGVAAPRAWAQATPRTKPNVERPKDLEELAFADIATLSELVHTKKVSCVELTELSLARLKRFDPKLLCVVTLCEERARKQAKALDDELAQGKWRGPLHGIPWGAKDLLSTKGIRTTWGSGPFENQMLDEDAAVVEKLDAAGAVLVAKLSLGELAMGDVWYGGTTKNPWKTNEGSSGSSAGPASATAAGCVAFAIGSETCGSITSPSSVCGCTSLRPTFGRVSRRGAMALAWTMDKLGPICRSFADCAIVFDAIRGSDPLDDYSVDAPFVDLGNPSVKGWKVGYIKGSWRDPKVEEKRLDELRALGVELVEVKLPEYPIFDMLTLLSAEAAAAFDEFTRTHVADKMTQQGENAWPNIFRTSRLIPAVEYIRANRLRRLLMRDMSKVYEKVDVIVHATNSDEWQVLENLTGNPTVCAPTELSAEGKPGSVSFSAQCFDETRALAVAEAWQRATGYNANHPPLE